MPIQVLLGFLKLSVVCPRFSYMGRILRSVGDLKELGNKHEEAWQMDLGVSWNTKGALK